MLRTTVRDCLYLNWAFPAESLPAPPAPLRYQLHSWQGRDHVFASALLFHQDSLHFTGLPRLKFRYPQLNVRVYVLDEEGVPSVLFRKMLMPAWVAPGVRLMTHQPASRARLSFPRPSRSVNGGPWLWRAQHKGHMEVKAWQDSPKVGEGPRLGSWDQAVRYFQDRPRGYALASDRLHRIDRGADAGGRLAGGGRGGRRRPAAAPAGGPRGDVLARPPLGVALPGDPHRLRAGAGPQGAGGPRDPAAAGGGTGGELLPAVGIRMRRRPSRKAPGVVLASPA